MMRKFLAGLLSISMLFLVACSSIGEGDGNQETNIVPDPIEMGITIQTEYFEWTVQSLQHVRYHSANYLIADITFTNLTEDLYTFNSGYVYAYLNNEQIVNVSERDLQDLADVVNLDLVTLEAEIHPGRTLRTFVVYQYFRDYTYFEVQYHDVITKGLKSEVSEFRKVVSKPASYIPAPPETEATTTTTTQATTVPSTQDPATTTQPAQTTTKVTASQQPSETTKKTESSQKATETTTAATKAAVTTTTKAPAPPAA